MLSGLASLEKIELSRGSKGGMRSAFEYQGAKIYGQVLLGFMLICTIQFSQADTNPTDVSAINNLYAALGFPVLPGWVPSGGDPCGQAWQGIQCNGSDIQTIVLVGANLGGKLGDSLGTFASLKKIDLSNNHIGGSIPSSLPVSLQNFFLSDNQFTGSIPTSLSTLTELTVISFNDNQLSGEISDVFQSLTKLVNLDLSNNNFSGELPPSAENLSALAALHLQNNQLSGTLDVLQDLSLNDLNVENNQFNGPIPQKLLSIPNFRKDGNPFNVNGTTASAPPSHSPATPPPGTVVAGAPTTGHVPSTTKPAEGPTTSKESNSGKAKNNTKRVVWISVASVLGFIILLLALLLFTPRCRRRERVGRISKQHQIEAYGDDRHNHRNHGTSVQPPSQTEKVPKEAVKTKEDRQAEARRVEAIPRSQDEQEKDVPRMGSLPKPDDHEIDMSALDVYSLPTPPPPPPPPPLPPNEEVTAEPIPFPRGATVNPSVKKPVSPTFAKSFTIASLQQYTNSFSQDNLIGGGMLGNVYRAELPDGKLLAVKKLDKRVSEQQKDHEFLELVDSIDRIRHANIVELIGFCTEHGQRLLIYEYCSNGSLQDALHSDDEFKTRLSWNARIRIALGAARALEYLHEICQPPVVHRNFKAANILLDDDLSVLVSDCGLAPLIASGSVSQLSGHLLTAYGYGAPEFESGIYTHQSDVYSFGVVMLELLTGRQSYDRARSRGEQFLVRWAIPQLHDIDALSNMVDPSLNGDYPAKSLSNFADIISQCVQSEPEFRPPMSEVVQYLLDMMRKESHRSGSNED